MTGRAAALLLCFFLVEWPAGRVEAGQLATDNVVMTLPANVAGVFAGNVEFSQQAFPIRATQADTSVQGALRAARPVPCRDCRSSGVIVKKQSQYPKDGPFMRTPHVTSTKHACAACGGYGTAYPKAYGQRLVGLIDRFSHVRRGWNYDRLLSVAKERLASVFERRFKKTPTGETTGTLHIDVRNLVTPLWPKAKDGIPAGQAVLVVGNVTDRVEQGGWVWMRVRSGPRRRVSKKRWVVPVTGILLCGTPETCTVPTGSAAIGGLMVGRWTSPGKGDATTTYPVILVTLSAPAP